tara:strand:- start:2465 stop:2740 length:276 start_codon:yes stop_codon:yes gene_type:complete
MLESKIEKDSLKEAAKHGWFAFKVMSQLNKGLPDKCFIGHGKVVFIEYKQPGKQPTKLQAKVHQTFLEHGVKVHVCTSIDETMEVLNSYIP